MKAGGLLDITIFLNAYGGFHGMKTEGWKLEASCGRRSLDRMWRRAWDSWVREYRSTKVGFISYETALLVRHRRPYPGFIILFIIIFKWFCLCIYKVTLFKYILL
jgi:hypothetical protein